MNSQQKKWMYLLILSIVWGSSFILIKKSLQGVTPVQLGALRMLITAFFLLLIGFKSIKKIEKKHWKYVAYSAALGTFFPVFLFAFAIRGIDSAIVSILNSLTPFHTFIFGALVFGFSFKKKQFIGILLGLVGTLILIFEGAALHPDQNYWYALLIIIASIGYAFNVNIIKRYLYDLDALAITTGNFLLLIIPALLVLIFSNFFLTFEMNQETGEALGYIIILSVVGTGIAKVLFNKMVHLSSPIFAASVTYLIPIVAVVWGIIDGEKLSLLQLLAGGIILLGVYWVNKVK
ncbi:DMT family transporter [Tenacibaculum maritimum]|uniref:DMT family transporter n=1 Tax=Tenacibaculum maritimum TaxID=107401 RepID=UPI0012E4F9E1|nr:DMT family transporter [Tenacibaculum maritimum]MCD9581921.1 DMT family transporter [Tenacibaculum maritimum]MCD9636335.1 DMT family transporter [Tenacibaculum maritimum]CAA0187950.1 Putative permease of the drug/metabolite transporter (DMT) superfamily [Tenacibaculum maritimum]CAA0214276.1 Putative permease of the drug/metabolite transporter (DMT) superfamily [Tenacibaculum maritimum]